MKKLIIIMFLIISLGYSFALEKCVTFEKDKVCFKLEKLSLSKYKINPIITSNTGGIHFLKCNILLPNGKLKNLGKCNQSFNYIGLDKKSFQLYVNYDLKYNKVINFIVPDYRILKLSQQLKLIELKLSKKYPMLKNNNKWIKLTNILSEELEKLAYGKKSKLSKANYKKYIKAYVLYTLKLIKNKNVER